MKKVKIELSISEASELMIVAENGYGDGDFYRGTGKGYKQKEKAFHRANEKVWEAIKDSRKVRGSK